jgi:hypothetical protein
VEGVRSGDGRRRHVRDGELAREAVGIARGLGRPLTASCSRHRPDRDGESVTVRRKRSERASTAEVGLGSEPA